MMNPSASLGPSEIKSYSDLITIKNPYVPFKFNIVAANNR